MEMSEKEFEKLAEEVHGVYCAERLRQGREPYWTGGDYKKLDEPTKDYDRAFIRWHLNRLRQELAGAGRTIEQLQDTFNFYRSYSEQVPLDRDHEAQRAKAREAYQRMSLLCQRDQCCESSGGDERAK